MMVAPANHLGLQTPHLRGWVPGPALLPEKGVSPVA